MTFFIGVDLAWKAEKNGSGIVVTQGNSEKSHLVSYCWQIGVGTICSFIEEIDPKSCVIAVDAPLIFENHSGSRPVDRLISRRFGRFEAGAHSVNTQRYPAASSKQLLRSLLNCGFRHPNPFSDEQSSEKIVIEVYPHPAQVVLFDLKKTLKYKKGPLQQKKYALQNYRTMLETLIFSGTPRIEISAPLQALLGNDLQVLTTKELKQQEDILDALFCAYLAQYYWTWAGEKCEMIGDYETGYIVNPLVKELTQHVDG